MKAIIMSIKPQWVAKILHGEKTVEIRKNAPKSKLPIDVYIYCTKTKGRLVLNKENCAYFTRWIEEGGRKLNGKVVAKFTLLRADEFDMGKPYEEPTSGFLEKACVTLGQARTYANGKRRLYAWQISDLRIFEKPKPLSEFFSLPKIINGPYGPEMGNVSLDTPQSWQYTEVEE